MRRLIDKTLSAIIMLLTIAALFALAFVIFFIIKEALPAFKEVGLFEFLFGQRWMPVDYGIGLDFGIFNFIAGTVFVSLLAMVFAGVVGLGAAIFLSCVAGPKTRGFIYPAVDLLAGVPSVVYGFVGLMVLVKIFLRIGVHTGTCVLAAAILLSVMLLPFLVSSCSDSMLEVKERYLGASDALGVDRWYAVATIVLPASWHNILFSMILAIGRAMGETMAVMMVIGNANLFPLLLGKGETISSLIALEMGTAVAGSTHYHALYAAGLVLMLLVLLINGIIMILRRKLIKKGGVTNA